MTSFTFTQPTPFPKVIPTKKKNTCGIPTDPRLLRRSLCVRGRCQHLYLFALHLADSGGFWKSQQKTDESMNPMSSWRGGNSVSSNHNNNYYYNNNNNNNNFFRISIFLAYSDSDDVHGHFQMVSKQLENVDAKIWAIWLKFQVPPFPKSTWKQKKTESKGRQGHIQQFKTCHL